MQYALKYDNNGNMLTSRTNSYISSYTSKYITNTYDVWGRLTNYDDGLGNQAEYAYYSDGLRKSKTTDGVTTTYYYNGDNVINETRSNNSSYATNVMGVNGVILRKQAGTTGQSDTLNIFI